MNKSKKIPIAVTADKEVLPFILKYYTKNGTMPTLREISAHFGKTPEWARQCLLTLEKAGKIKRGKFKLRAIKITI